MVFYIWIIFSLRCFASIKAVQFILMKQSGSHLFFRDCALHHMWLFCLWKVPTTQNLIFCRCVTAVCLSWLWFSTWHQWKQGKGLQPSHTWSVEKVEGMLATVSNGIINAPLRITEVVLIQGPRLVMPLLQMEVMSAVWGDIPRNTVWNLQAWLCMVTAENAQVSLRTICKGYHALV